MDYRWCFGVEYNGNQISTLNPLDWQPYPSLSRLALGPKNIIIYVWPKNDLTSKGIGMDDFRNMPEPMDKHLNSIKSEATGNLKYYLVSSIISTTVLNPTTWTIWLHVCFSKSTSNPQMQCSVHIPKNYITSDCCFGYHKPSLASAYFNRDDHAQYHYLTVDYRFNPCNP